MRRPMGWPRTDMGQVTSQDAVALSQAQANLASVTQKQHIHIDLGTERATCTLQASLLFPAEPERPCVAIVDRRRHECHLYGQPH